MMQDRAMITTDFCYRNSYLLYAIGYLGWLYKVISTFNYWSYISKTITQLGWV